MSGLAWGRGARQGRPWGPMVACGCPEQAVDGGWALGALAPSLASIRVPPLVTGRDLGMGLVAVEAPLRTQGLGLGPACLVEGHLALVEWRAGPQALLCPLWSTCGAPWMSWGTRPLGFHPTLACLTPRPRRPPPACSGQTSLPNSTHSTHSRRRQRSRGPIKWPRHRIDEGPLWRQWCALLPFFPANLGSPSVPSKAFQMAIAPLLCLLFLSFFC